MVCSKRDFSGQTKTNDQTMDDQDRFSKLPEPLIIEILSLLELKDAVKTGVLAKSWRNIWTRVFNIILHRPTEFPDRTFEQWMYSVDRTLAQCTSPSINRFHLYGYCDLSDVIDKWITFALDRNVKIMELFNNPCVGDDRLFQSSSITKMELCDIDVSSSSPVNLSSLKSLCLDSTDVDDNFLENILLGSPVLEDLVLDSVNDLYNINITSPSVKRFKLVWFGNEYLTPFLSIKAPWIQELELTKGFITTQCELGDVSSLTKATLTFHNKLLEDNISDKDEDYPGELAEYNSRWIPMVNKLLDSLSFVGELTVGTYPLQVLSLAKLLGTSSPLFKCKKLSIESYLWKFDLPGIACLLENAPHLETLVVKVLPLWQDWYPLDQIMELFTDRNPHLKIPSGKLMHLKNIKIEYSRYYCSDYHKSSRGECFDFEIVDYILRSAVSVEKLVLCSSTEGCFYSDCPSRNCAFRYIPCLSAKLLATFLSGNEDAADWEVKKSKDKFVFTFSNYASLRPTADSSSL